MMGQYYSRIIRYAVELWLQRLKDGRKKLIGFIIQTTIVFAALYYLPFMGSLSDKAGMVGLTIIAVLASSVLYFLWDLVRAPVRIDHFQRFDLGFAIKQAEDVLDKETRMRSLGNLYSEGTELKERHLKTDELQSSFEEWNTRCDKYIEDNFEYSYLHRYRNSGSRFTTSTWVDGKPIRSKYEDLIGAIDGKLSSIDNIIVMGGGLFISSIGFSHLLEITNHPIYKYLAPIHPDDKS